MDNIDLKDELTTLLEKEIGFTGKFILEKQCQRINIKPDDINASNLGILADQIHWAVKGFTGSKKAEEIKRGILEYKRAIDTISDDEKNVGKEENSGDLIEAQLTICEKRLAVSKIDGATEAVRKALDIFENSDLKDDLNLKARVKRHLARALGQTKASREEAIKTYEEVIDIARESNNAYEESLAWHGLGLLSWRVGEHVKSKERYDKALKVLKTMKAVSKTEKYKKQRVEGRIHSGLGNTYLDLLEMEKSIKHNELAIEIYTKQEDFAGVGLVYNNVSRVYEEMGNFRKAIDGYERGIHHCHDAGSLRMEGWTMTNLASTLIEDGRVDEAEEHLYKAQRILADFSDPIAHSKLHCMYGKYYRERKEWGDSESHFKQSIAFVIYETSPDYLALAQEEFGLMHYKKGDKDNARKYLEDALEWYIKKNETTRIEKIKSILEKIG